MTRISLLRDLTKKSSKYNTNILFDLEPVLGFLEQGFKYSHLKGSEDSKI